MIEKAKKVEDLIKVFEPYPLMENDSFEKFYVDTYDAGGQMLFNECPMV